MKNQVQLIAYAHRFGGGGIAELSSLLHGPLRGLFGAVHLLPFFYPIDGSDAGFDPIDHTQVDPQLGGWGDVKALARDIDVMADVIVNHMSADSAQFRDYSKHGAASQFDGLFLTREAVFPNGATEADQEAAAPTVQQQDSLSRLERRAHGPKAIARDQPDRAAHSGRSTISAGPGRRRTVPRCGRFVAW